MSEEEKRRTTDSKYIQQHLANERTYLAWVRTAIAIIGLGILTTTLHVSVMAVVISIIAFLFGITIIFMSTYLYMKNRKTINTSVFESSNISIIFTSVIVGLLLCIFIAYFNTIL